MLSNLRQIPTPLVDTTDEQERSFKKYNEYSCWNATFATFAV